MSPMPGKTKISTLKMRAQLATATAFFLARAVAVLPLQYGVPEPDPRFSGPHRRQAGRAFAV